MLMFFVASLYPQNAASQQVSSSLAKSRSQPTGHMDEQEEYLHTYRKCVCLLSGLGEG